MSERLYAWMHRVSVSGYRESQKFVGSAPSNNMQYGENVSYHLAHCLPPLPPPRARLADQNTTVAGNPRRRTSTTAVADGGPHLQGRTHGNDVPEFPRVQIHRDLGPVVHWFKLHVTFNGFRSPTIPKVAIDMIKPLLTEEQKKRITQVDDSGSINLQLLALHPKGQALITIHRTYVGKGSFKISRGWSEVRDENSVKANGTSILDLWLPNQNPLPFIVITLRGVQSPTPPMTAGLMIGA